MNRAFRVLAPALSLFAASCVSAADGSKSVDPPKTAAVAEAGSKDAAAEAKAAEAKERARARKAEKRAHELEIARAELAIAELEVQSGERDAVVKLEDERRALEEASQALQHFTTREVPRQLAEAQLSLDRSIQRRLEAEQELREMEATYEKDQFAKDTKELVLTRHRKQLEFATRQLELAEQEYADTKQVELPRKVREQEQKLRSAEQDVRRAEVALQKSRMSAEVSLARKRFALHELERPIEDDEDSGSKGKG